MIFRRAGGSLLQKKAFGVSALQIVKCRFVQVSVFMDLITLHHLSLSRSVLARYLKAASAIF